MEGPSYWRQMEGKRLSRRALLKSTAAAFAAVGLGAACGGEEKPAGGIGPAAGTPAVVSGPGNGTARNAIVVMLDTLRADHVGCYGNDWIETPAMDALAEESILFTRAYPESLATIPGRRSMHTGLRTWPFRVWALERGNVPLPGWQHIPEEQITVHEAMVDAGLHTVFVTDTHHFFKPSQNFHRGFRQWRWVRGHESDPHRSIVEVKPEEVEQFLPEGLDEKKSSHTRLLLTQYLANQGERESEEDYQAPRVFRGAMELLEENQKVDRFFLLVDSFDPHEPWDPPKKYVDLYDRGYEGREIIQPLYAPSDYLTEAELKHMRALYAASVTMVDRWLGLFLERARELGMLEDTLLIVTSDHGHQLGEHGLTGKLPGGLWYELMDVPLLVRRPDGVGAGTRVDAFAQLHDIPPTVLKALGVEPPAPQDGMDLLELAAERVAPREQVSAGYAFNSWCRDERYVYFAGNDGRAPHLYDMVADPLQEQDLAAEEQGVVEQMHEKLLADAGGPLPV
ncbi:MAG: sulfatase [Dehalococcoidia bacterium]